MGIMTAITGLYGLVNAFSDKLFVPSIYGAFGLLAATLIMLFLLNSDKITFSKKQFRGIVLGITALVIFLNAKWFITSGDDSYTHLDTYVSAGNSKKKISGTALKHLDEVPGADTDNFIEVPILLQRVTFVLPVCYMDIMMFLHLAVR